MSIHFDKHLYNYLGYDLRCLTNNELSSEKHLDCDLNVTLKDPTKIESEFRNSFVHITSSGTLPKSNILDEQDIVEDILSKNVSY